jgi:hypothetical protein
MAAPLQPAGCLHTTFTMVPTWEHTVGVLSVPVLHIISLAFACEGWMTCCMRQLCHLHACCIAF